MIRGKLIFRILVCQCIDTGHVITSRLSFLCYSAVVLDPCSDPFSNHLAGNDNALAKRACSFPIGL